MALEIVQIIEDEPAHAGLLDHALRKARYRTNISGDGETGLNDCRRLRPALILLDVMLPGMDGHEVFRRLREDRRTHTTPIIMVSALGSLHNDHRAQAIEAGADDYIGKPFSPREVIARVNSILHRSRCVESTLDPEVQDQIKLEERYYRVRFRGRPLELTGREWDILCRLARQPGKVVTREELTALLWGDDDPVHEHELYRQVRSLATKLDGNGRDWGALIAVPNGSFELKLLPYETEAADLRN